jgi:hypothetical protein
MPPKRRGGSKLGRKKTRKKNTEDDESTRKPCKSCGGIDHERSSSHLCPFYVDRPGRTKPPDPPLGESDETGFWKEHHRSIKVGWRTLLRSPYLDEKVQWAVDEMTKLSFEVSRLLQYHVQRCFEAGLPTPNIVHDTWLRQCFSIFKNGVATDLELQNSYNVYLARRTTMEPLPALVATPPEMVTIAVRDFLTNITTHIERLYPIVVKRWMAAVFASRGLPKKHARRLAKFVSGILLQPGDFTDDICDLHQEEVTMKAMVRAVQDSNIDWRSRLSFIYRMNKWLMTQHNRLCVLTPIFSAEAKYVTIDTDILHSLLGSKRGTGVTKKAFGHNQVVQWVKHFRLPPRFIMAEDDLPETKKFWFMVTTDGVGASLLVQRWNWIPKRAEPSKTSTPIPTQKRPPLQDRQQTQISEARRLLQTCSDPVLIGLDPGRKSLATLVKDYGPNRDQRVLDLSTGRYYEESGFNYRTDKQKRFLEDTGLKDWWEAVPSLKLGTSGSTMDNVEYLFASGNGNMTKMFSLRLGRSCKKLRWRTYIHQKKTLARFVKEILADIPPERGVIIGFGDASFNSSSAGHPSSPRTDELKRLLVRAKEKARWRRYNVAVVDIWEFNTSKVCSKCHALRRLKGLKRVSVSKKHFVRSCQEPTCRTIWNR